MTTDSLTLAGYRFQSRLFTGTGKFDDKNTMVDALKASGSELVTMALKRIDIETQADDILAPLIENQMKLLPNTSGAKTAEDAIFAARLAREALGTNWIKLEVHPDQKYLMPDPVETLKAAEVLCQEGFIVLPYMHADPVLARRLAEVGCAAVMPLGAPIGSNKGLVCQDFLKMIIEQSSVPVIVDAGIGAPSHAALAMEMGADAVLINTAMAVSPNPVEMARAFSMAVKAGRIAYLSGLGQINNQAIATSPLTAFLD